MDIIKTNRNSFRSLSFNKLSESCSCEECNTVSITKQEKFKQEFIRKANKKHNNKYDYSNVNYVDNYTKVCIICPLHGEFKQTPKNHLRGNNCKKCSIDLRRKPKSEKISKTDQFIQKAREIYGNLYDYSKVNYTNYSTKLSIICRIHGEFKQLAKDHLSKKGCPICKGKLTKEGFIEKSKELHGNKYDYSKVEYKNVSTKVIIICPIHGEFKQTPFNHLSGKGCYSCGRNHGKLRKTKEEFIFQLKEIYGDRFDLSRIDYKESHTKVILGCEKHGWFEQYPSELLYNKTSCPRCSREWKLEVVVRKLLENNNIKYISQKTFDWLKYKGSQSLDFYLPEYNIAIECQGRQHFMAVDFFGGEKTFKLYKDRDSNKLDLCDKNGIKLLYFSNYKYEDNVITEVEELLFIIKSKGKI